MNKHNNNFKGVILFSVSVFMMCSNIFLCTANSSVTAKQTDDGQTIELRSDPKEIMEGYIQQYWQREKAEVFRLANEQDKYILLLSGRHGCLNCRTVTERLATDESLLKLVTEEYILWHSNYDSTARRREIAEYINQPYENGAVQQIPLMHIINPKNPGVSIWGHWGSMSVASLKRALNFELSLSESGLEWHTDKDIVVRLAKEQNKNIFKFVGRATSNNSKDVLNLLSEEPLRQTLSENFILWYSRYDDQTLEGPEPEDPEPNDPEPEDPENDPEDPENDPEDTGNDPEDTENDPEDTENGPEDNTEPENNIPKNTTKAPPYIYIINPDNPNTYIVAENGLKDINTINQLLNDVIVSNDYIDLQDDNNVILNNNKLYISNKINNELIRVYSTTGQLLYSVNKKESAITIDASSFPNGVLIINSSDGWSTKAIKR